jgi:hypothetical protein
MAYLVIANLSGDSPQNGTLFSQQIASFKIAVAS